MQILRYGKGNFVGSCFFQAVSIVVVSIVVNTSAKQGIRILESFSAIIGIERWMTFF